MYIVLKQKRKRRFGSFFSSDVNIDMASLNKELKKCIARDINSLYIFYSIEPLEQMVNEPCFLDLEHDSYGVIVELWGEFIDTAQPHTIALNELYKRWVGSDLDLVDNKTYNCSLVAYRNISIRSALVTEETCNQLKNNNDQHLSCVLS